MSKPAAPARGRSAAGPGRRAARGRSAGSRTAGCRRPARGRRRLRPARAARASGSSPRSPRAGGRPVPARRRRRGARGLAATASTRPARSPARARCGGCDFQHVDARRPSATSRPRSCAEQLQRLAGLDVDVEVESVAGDDDGSAGAPACSGRSLARRRRACASTAPTTSYRSTDCRIAHPGLPDVTGTVAGRGGVSRWSPRPATFRLVTTADGTTFADGPRCSPRRPPAGPGRSPRLLAGAPRCRRHPGDGRARGADPQPGERAADLYSGVGLFSGALAERVGPPATSSPSSPTGSPSRTRPRTCPTCTRSRWSGTGSTGRWPRTLGPRDLVVLDPPRTGAKRDVVAGDHRPGPAGRRLRRLRPGRPRAGHRPTSPSRATALADLRAFDLFPMTHHIECVVILKPVAPRAD